MPNLPISAEISSVSGIEQFHRKETRPKFQFSFTNHRILFSSVIYCGPMEWRFERRRGSSVDRKNTVRHLIQMMAITESEKEDQASLSQFGLELQLLLMSI